MPAGKLIDEEGRPRFGVFDDAVDVVNVEAYRHRTAMGSHAGAFRRWVGFKQFQYFGVIAPELLFGCALAHLRHTSIVFLYLYLPGEGLVLDRSARLPGGLTTHLALSPVDGVTSFGAAAYRVGMRYEETPRRKMLDVAWGRDLAVQAALDETAHDFEPMSICTRIGRAGWVYAHKVAGVPTTGRIRYRDRLFDLELAGAHGHHDFSAGYMRRDTFWNWACFSGQLADGRRAGLNVSCGVNETSFSENCLWIDGKLHPVDLCHFEYDWDRPLEPWRVTSRDGRVDLQFVPEGQHAERLRLGLVASDFKQVFGRFDGSMRLGDGEAITIDGLYGFVEDQYARW